MALSFGSYAVSIESLIPELHKTPSSRAVLVPQPASGSHQAMAAVQASDLNLCTDDRPNRAFSVHFMGRTPEKVRGKPMGS
jgi:hypothetical protein